jgi:hypothetical protein
MHDLNPTITVYHSIGKIDSYVVRMCFPYSLSQETRKQCDPSPLVREIGLFWLADSGEAAGKASLALLNLP